MTRPIYIVFQIGQFGGVTLHAFEIKSDAENFQQELKYSRPKDMVRIETVDLK